jgi:HK97 gp10 family phage protein
MGKMTLQLEGLAELQETFGEIAPKQARNILRAAVHGIAGKVRDRMKSRVKKRTGKLAKNIKAIRRQPRDPNAPFSDVRGGDAAPYMLMLEFGTKKTKAQPFIIPTVEETRPNLRAEYREEFGKKLEKSLARQAKAANK